jgi:hypothetical protein
MSTKIVTGKVRFSYANVFTPRAANDGAKEKYSVSLIIPKSDTATIAKIKQAIKAASEDGKNKKFGGTIPANLKQPLRDGDIEKPGDPVYENSMFVNANSIHAPGIVDASLNRIIDPEAFYSGCYGRAEVTFYAFNESGNRGIACGLNSLQKLEDGEPLGGRSNPEQAFAEPADDLF